MKRDDVQRRAATWLLWTARVLSALMTAYWLMAGIGGAISEPGPLTVESAVVAIMIVLATISVVIAWLRTGIGGAILLAFGVIFSISAYFMAGGRRGFAMAVSGGPFIGFGALFLTSWQLRRTAGADGNAGQKAEA